MDLEWDTPPKGKTNSRRDWAAVAEALRSRPGEWAIIDRDVSRSNVVVYRRGANKAFPKGEFEFRGVNTTDNRTEKLYARYVGKDDNGD